MAAINPSWFGTTMAMTLDLCLEQPPRIAAAAANAVHGEHGPEQYRLAGLWCLNLYQGEGTFTVNGQTHHFRPGCASLTPPGVDYAFTFSCRTVKTWVHFAPAAGPTVRVPVMADLGDRFAQVQVNLVEACVALHSERARATARIWDVLWRLVGSDSASETEANPILRSAIDFVEYHLVHALAPDGIARACGISPTHLNRLMRKRFGLATMDYVRRRRAERAGHLLRHTSLPVGRIGEMVGIDDPHMFNKTIRRELGKAPRDLREPG
jgi:AraC family transcriptional regulator